MRETKPRRSDLATHGRGRDAVNASFPAMRRSPCTFSHGVEPAKEATVAFVQEQVQ